MDGHEGYYVYGNLKKELDSKYSWLWGTTYWLRTYDQEMNVVRGSSNSYGLLFVDTMVMFALMVIVVLLEQELDQLLKLMLKILLSLCL